MRPPALLLCLILALAPVASASSTLSTFEEPHKGQDKVWDFAVLQEEAGKPRALVFRNPVGSGFSLIVYDSQGQEVFIRNGSRGVQTLPGFEPGTYRFFVRGLGEFQATDKALERGGLLNVDARLNGTDAYVLSPTKHYRIDVEGDVEVEFWDMTQRASTQPAPLSAIAEQGKAYVLTLRGAEGAAYTIALTETEAPAKDETPAPGAALAALALALVALALRRR